jgi:hypothetical protein
VSNSCWDRVRNWQLPSPSITSTSRFRRSSLCSSRLSWVSLCSPCAGRDSQMQAEDRNYVISPATLESAVLHVHAASAILHTGLKAFLLGQPMCLARNPRHDLGQSVPSASETDGDIRHPSAPVTTDAGSSRLPPASALTWCVRLNCSSRTTSTSSAFLLAVHSSEGCRWWPVGEHHQSVHQEGLGGCMWPQTLQADNTAGNSTMLMVS